MDLGNLSSATAPCQAEETAAGKDQTGQSCTHDRTRNRSTEGTGTQITTGSIAADTEIPRKHGRPMLTAGFWYEVLVAADCCSEFKILAT